MSIRIGVIGARGHTGKELLSLLAHHPEFQLVAAGSRSRAGESVANYLDDPVTDVIFENLSANRLPPMDACVLALPNGYSRDFVESLKTNQRNCVICDLSADYRFDDTWYYGLPELNRHRFSYGSPIANPGCYATAMQLAVAPVKYILTGPVTCFGVSGYSGAGTTPSDKNDPEILKANLLPYCSTDHIHQTEVSHQLRTEIHFSPHVAEFFRGIAMTVSMNLARPLALAHIESLYLEAYSDEPFVGVQEDVPQVTQTRYRHHATVGGFSVAENGKRLVAFCTLDNLLKGAASQALQNLNRAFGLPETLGLIYV